MLHNTNICFHGNILTIKNSSGTFFNLITSAILSETEKFLAQTAVHFEQFLQGFYQDSDYLAIISLTVIIISICVHISTHNFRDRQSFRAFTNA